MLNQYNDGPIGSEKMLASERCVPDYENFVYLFEKM